MSVISLDIQSEQVGYVTIDGVATSNPFSPKAACAIVEGVGGSEFGKWTYGEPMKVWLRVCR